MKKFLTGLRYGNWLTRLYVISIPICILVGIVLIVLSFVWNRMFLFLIGVGVAIGGIALSQSFTIEEGEAEQVKESELEDKPQKESKPKNKHKKESEVEDKPQKESKPKSKHKKESEAKDKPQKEAEQKEVKEPAEESKPKPEELEAYDEKRMKQVFYKYKVKKEHRLIMIDEWKEKGVHQKPAYIWVNRGQMHLLVIGEEILEYTISIGKATTLLFQKGIICQTKEEYPQFRKESLLSKTFSPYLPVYHEGDKNGRPVIYKNLFEFGNGIQVTNTSVKNVKDLLQAEIQVDDIVTRDLRYNSFFKECYKLGVLLREQVLSVKEYQDQINDILQDFAKDDVSDKEYEDTLQLLCRQRLISQEFTEYYKQYRIRLRAEEEASNAGQNSKKDSKLRNKRKFRSRNDIVNRDKGITENKKK